MYMWTKPLPTPTPKPSPEVLEPIQMFYLDDMVVWQRFTGDRAYGIGIMTDPNDLSWVCFVDKPLHIAHCEMTIRPPEIPEANIGHIVDVMKATNL